MKSNDSPNIGMADSDPSAAQIPPDHLAQPTATTTTTPGITTTTTPASTTTTGGSTQQETPGLVIPLNDLWWIVLVVAVGLLFVGLILLLARGKATTSRSVVRGWIAMSLTLGLLVFCAFAFFVNDTTLRSTLLGALTASLGAAIGFYFSSRSGEQASNDLLAAQRGTDTVPDLQGMKQVDAEILMSKRSLILDTGPRNPSADHDSTIKSQDPRPNTLVLKGSSVKVEF